MFLLTVMTKQAVHKQKNRTHFYLRRVGGLFSRTQFYLYSMTLTFFLTILMHVISELFCEHLSLLHHKNVITSIKLTSSSLSKVTIYASLVQHQVTETLQKAWKFGQLEVSNVFTRCSIQYIMSNSAGMELCQRGFLQL